MGKNGGICCINYLCSNLDYILVFIVFHVLHAALYLLLFSKNELSIDGKKQGLKKEWNNNTIVTKREKCIGLVVLIEPISHIRHTHKY